MEKGKLKDKCAEMERLAADLFSAMKDVIDELDYCKAITVHGDACKDEKLVLRIEMGLPPGMTMNQAIEKGNYNR